MNRWKCCSGLLSALILLAGCAGEKTPPADPSQTAADQEQTKDAEMNAGSNFQLGVQAEPYGTTADGQDITQFLLSNNKGTSVSIINLGAIVTAIYLPDRDGKTENITLGFDSLAGYEGVIQGLTVQRQVDRSSHPSVVKGFVLGV